MKSSNFSTFSLILAAATLVFPAAKPAHADTYEIIDFDFGLSVADQLVGIEPSGAVVFYSTVGPCGIEITCWSTWLDGKLVSYTSTNPNPIYDNGTFCTPTTSLSVSSDEIADSACNNGYEVFGTDEEMPSPYTDEIFDGPDPVADYVGLGVLDELDLNSSGDFVYLIDAQGILPDQAHGEYYEAIDLTTASTPEPASILMCGTGVLGVFWAMRRRWLLPR